MDLVDKFDRGDYGKNKSRKTSTSIKRPIGVDYLYSNHVNYAVSNFVSNCAKNVSNYLIPDAKKAFDQLHQVSIEAPIL